MIGPRLDKQNIDLEAWEFFTRTVALSAGAKALEATFARVLAEEENETPLCANQHQPREMRKIDRRPKTIRTILGAIRLERAYWICPLCGATRLPADERLGISGTGFSPGARRMMARAGSKTSFAEAADDLAIYADLKVDAKDVERMAENTGLVVEEWMSREASLATLAPPEESPETLYVEFDGTGVPARKQELKNSKGKAPDGKARTREVKLGCVFTQTELDEKGKPVRDDNSTSYVGAIENSADFGYRIRAEAVRRGLLGAERVVALTDGAAYNKTIIGEHFPRAIRILDFYHATEHLGDFLRDVCLLPANGEVFHELRDLIWRGRIDDLIGRMEEMLPRNGPRRKKGKSEINYFKNNAYAMRYEEFREQGLFIGSGVIESACKTLIAKRLKGAGMFWTVRGANAIIALRCCLSSGMFEQFWEDTA